MVASEIKISDAGIILSARCRTEEHCNECEKIRGLNIYKILPHELGSVASAAIERRLRCSLISCVNVSARCGIELKNAMIKLSGNSIFIFGRHK